MIKKILHTLITKILYSLLGFLIIILISQNLGAIGKGEQALFLLNMVLLLLFATLIGNSTLIYLTPRYKFSHLFFPSLLWIISSLILVFLIWYFLSLQFPKITIKHPIELLIITFFASITEINAFILIGKEKIHQANNLKLISQIILFLILLSLSLFGAFTKSYQYVIALILGYSISFIYGIYLLKEEYFNLTIPTKKEFKEMFKELFRLGAVKQIGSLAQQLNSRFSFFLISFYVGKGALGVFSNSISLSEFVLMFGTSLALVQYSRLSNSQDKNYANKLTLSMTKLNLIFTFVSLCVLSFLPASFYTLLFGQEFAQVKPLIQYLFLGILLLSISSTFTQYFASKGNFKISATASVLSLAITIVLGLVLIPRYGIIGAALTTVASYTLSFAVEYYYFKKWTNTKLKDFLISKQDLRDFKTLINPNKL